MNEIIVREPLFSTRSDQPNKPAAIKHQQSRVHPRNRSNPLSLIALAWVIQKKR